MYFYIYIYITVLVINVILALTILFAAKKERNSVSFIALEIGLIVWILTTLLSNLSDNYDVVLFWTKLAVIGPSFIPSVFLYFSWNFPKHKKVSMLEYLMLFIPSILILLTVNTSLNVKSIAFTNWGATVEAGEIYYFLFFYYIGYFLLAIHNLYKKSLNIQGRIKRQIRLIIYGVALTLSISVFTNIFLLFFEDNGSSLIGPPSTILFAMAIAITLIRHQFLDVRILIGRIVYYSLIGFLFYLAYFFIYFFDEVLFGGSTSSGGLLSGIPNAFIFAVFFVTLNTYLRKQVRSRIINPGYDPLEETDQLSRKIAGQLSINDISKTTLDTLSRTIRSEYQAVLVVPGETFKKTAKQKYLHELGDKREIKMESLEVLYKIWDRIGKYPIIFDEIELELPRHFRGLEPEIEQIMKCMRDKELKVIMPVKQSEENFAMLLIGQKEADSPYTNQDVEYLDGIATTLGLAITRSLYYLEVEDLNKNLQKRVNEATEELSKKNKALGDALEKLEEVRRQERDMVDVMGHELRTPITIVRNAVLMVKSKLEKKEASKKEILDYVEKAAEGAKRELELVETLLSATKVESNRIQMTLTKLDLNKVIEDAMFAHKHFADEKKLKVTYKKPKKKYYVYGDKTRFQEVIDNLVSNAIKYTFEGGIEINVKDAGKNIEIAVIDNGIGISKEDMKKLGKKFYRAKQHIPESIGESAKEGKIVRPGGTGLGLYVAFNLMELMNGKVDVESEVGKGSTFTVTIPEYNGQEDKHIEQTFKS